jgi:hypothetical protein
MEEIRHALELRHDVVNPGQCGLTEREGDAQSEI